MKQDWTTEAILKQTVANNKKVEALFEEHRERKKKAVETEESAQSSVIQRNKILLRIARVATGASVRWKRSLKINDASEEETGTEVERKKKSNTQADSLHAQDAESSKKPKRSSLK